MSLYKLTGLTARRAYITPLYRMTLVRLNVKLSLTLASLTNGKFSTNETQTKHRVLVVGCMCLVQGWVRKIRSRLCEF